MKKEINFEFIKGHSYREDEIKIEVFVGDMVLDSCIIGETSIEANFYVNTCKLLGITKYSFESYFTIPEIKKLHDEHFKKEVDLFSLCHKSGFYYYVDFNGKVECLSPHFKDSYYAMYEDNYNLFPTRERAEKAVVMSLDERKQYLFAIAKGYEVFTRNDLKKVPEETFRTLFYLYIDRYEKHVPTKPLNIFTANIYLKEQDAQECAEFMNGGK